MISMRCNLGTTLLTNVPGPSTPDTRARKPSSGRDEKKQKLSTGKISIVLVICQVPFHRATMIAPDKDFLPAGLGHRLRCRSKRGV
jgi:hypothetical protein